MFWTVPSRFQIAGARVSEIARSAGIHGSQLFRWRKELCQISAPSVPLLVQWKSSRSGLRRSRLCSNHRYRDGAKRAAR
ncbi:transposase [Mesorhizobium sp.]|uniref:transposase n=1 Tax=Mesorhizobium sp. TaxID=1871066 RepID=UPI000FCC75EA|nr:MAG: hypothetical protein EOS66_01050 [Mesorhizobium sp.]TGP38016.1 hypothetical protein EN875_003655 [Mesorhizobium sp. M2D.F.Ca.ET.232.01.1.1]TGP80194.1 hypothetical protein EN867_07855 [Mesorhizobium sp. M2D.F.Ca.ET.224.01.1.1]TGQ00349.1 hypothetical protein EN865_07855 [bacterium M00.F.Ca.ET.222.01.1.1]TGS35420.1 hypothetical protein EN828_03655 [Mesorhizobium sp. M2D.F.Ca.ET.185.01.1.1]TGU04056.1 hypothetical protein EN806_41340 [bacterium M00.F.Ca.ET.163.01.1.1]TGU26007.1 hypothetica